MRYKVRKLKWIKEDQIFICNRITHKFTISKWVTVKNKKMYKLIIEVEYPFDNDIFNNDIMGYMSNISFSSLKEAKQYAWEQYEEDIYKLFLE